MNDMYVIKVKDQNQFVYDDSIMGAFISDYPSVMDKESLKYILSNITSDDIEPVKIEDLEIQKIEIKILAD